MSREKIHFVTGKLAAHALRDTLERLAADRGFEFTIDVLPITVAALMTPKWVNRHLSIPEGTDRVVLPGYCDGDLAPILERTSADVQIGPRDLRRLPEFFGVDEQSEYGAYDIEIIAEINHAPRLSLDEILQQAQQLADDGADIIDVGCEPNGEWSGVAECVRALRDAGFRVSIDSLNPREIEPAVRSGAELVLSVNSTNRDAAVDWDCEVIVIPDDFDSLGGLDETVSQLAAANVRLRIDPILEPIGCGFAQSLGRYLKVRRRYPDAEMMMGIGNLTELTDVDSAGVNVLLLGICQELGIRSVLTTQVINWAQTSVRECDLGRRLVYYAVAQGVPPKHRERQLLTLRDDRVLETATSELERLATEIRDHNYRIFTSDGVVHLVSSNLHLSDRDPFLLFEKLQQSHPNNLDPSHAFYLGFEMAKAATAIQLGKEYRQDESLDWGYLTVAEPRHRLKFSGKSQSASPRADSPRQRES